MSRWIFTPKRKAALAKARLEHVRLVRLGESARARRRTGKE